MHAIGFAPGACNDPRCAGRRLAARAAHGMMTGGGDGSPALQIIMPQAAFFSRVRVLKVLLSI